MHLFLIFGPAMAATLTVDPSDSTAYENIQDAIDAASDGDTIEVAADTYSECIDTSGLDLTISGNSSDDTILDGDGDCDNTVSVQSGETVSITGLTLRNSGYRALWVYGSALDTEDVVIENSGSNTINGGGAYIDGGVVTMVDSSIVENTGDYGGNLYVTGASDVALQNVEISEGEAYYGAGIYLEDDSSSGGSQLRLSQSSVDDNTSYFSGAGVYIPAESEVDSVESSFTDNYAYYGSGVAVYAAGNYTSENDTFAENEVHASSSSSYMGGAVYANAALAGRPVHEWK